MAAAAAMTPKGARKAALGRRAWRRLRLAVLWARRGSAAQSLRLLSTLRRGGHGLLGGGRGDRLRYGEREFSIDETPAFRFRTPSARVLRLIPCIAPAVPDTPGVYGDDRYFFSSAREREAPAECSLGYYNGEHEGIGGGADEQLLERAMMEASCAGNDAAAEEGCDDDAGVDLKAEEFIAKFYAQMKLQRQISRLRYNEMMQRSLC